MRFIIPIFLNVFFLQKWILKTFYQIGMKNLRSANGSVRSILWSDSLSKRWLAFWLDVLTLAVPLLSVDFDNPSYFCLPNWPKWPLTRAMLPLRAFALVSTCSIYHSSKSLLRILNPLVLLVSYDLFIISAISVFFLVYQLQLFDLMFIIQSICCTSFFQGLLIHELEQVGDLGTIKDVTESERDQRRRKPRSSHKLRKHHTGGNGSQHFGSGKKVSVVGRPESLNTHSSDGSVSSLSLATTSTNSSNSSTSERRSAASSSTTSTASSAFIGPNGKAAPEVLKLIAGFNKGELTAVLFFHLLCSVD